MEEKDKLFKDIAEERRMEDEATKEDEEPSVCPGDTEETEAEEIIPVDVGDPKDEDEPTSEPEEEDIVPVAEEEMKGDPDKAKIAKLKAGIESSVKRGVRAGQDRYLARSLAYIEARRKALKTLGYIPEGFYKDKD